MAEWRNKMLDRQSLRNVHYALLTKDEIYGPGYNFSEYTKPKPLVGAISAKINPASKQEKLWADDGVFDISSTLGDIALEIELATLPVKAQAVLLGHTYENGVMTSIDTDEPPYLAIGFMSQYQLNKFRLVWLVKGKFSLLDYEYNTATDSAAWRNAKLTGTFVKRITDDTWQYTYDTGVDPAYDVDKWFANVAGSKPPDEEDAANPTATMPDDVTIDET
jgi:phi13 family phage major tail protein